MPPVSVTIFASNPGTYFLEDDGIPGNNFSRIRFPDGTFVSFEHPTDDLFFAPSVPGITLVVNLTDSLGTARFSAGDFTDPNATPDFIQLHNLHTTAGVTLVANNAITEFGADVGADIVAASLVLSAGTGVGTAVNALETQVGALEAETITGGINLSNFGTVAIGGLTDEVDGLDVLTSGNLIFTNFGAIVLSDDSGPETIHGGTTSGNVTLTANGIDSDIISNIDQDSISAPRGDITLTAGRDIGFGLIGANFDNDVRANGTITINTGRDFLMDGFADMVSDDFGQSTGGDIIINSGRNIIMLSVAGTDAGLTASGSAGANVILNTGPGGTVTLNSGNGTPPFASLISNSGDVIVNADRMVIGPSGAISSPNGQVTIQPISEGWDINLGSATDVAFVLELSDAELDRIFTPTLNIGSLDSGQLNVTAAISPLNALNLLLRSGTDIGINAAMTIGGALTLRAGDNLFQLPASAITLGGTFSAFVDEAGDDGNLGGFGILNGTVTATSITLNGNFEADTLNGSSSGETLLGNGGNDTLRGFGGNDSLDGGAGTDSMTGGFGDDFFFVDVATDVVLEGVGEGNDRVFAAVSYTLAGAGEVEILGTTNAAGTAAINFTGNAFAQAIVGNAGANTLDSGGGGDVMSGLGGNDFYFVRSSADRAVEAAGAGADRVFAAASFILEANSSVEIIGTIDQTAATAINLTGNNLNQTIVGNAGANTLDSGGGSDVMIGLGGDDFYFVRVGTDRAVEAAGAGDDRVFAAASFTLEAGSSVETLSTVASGAVTAINLTGNALAQSIVGNNGANTLDSGGGGDVMSGLGGDDFYFIRAAGDRAVETAGNGNDRVFAAVSFTLEVGSEVEIIGTTNAAGAAAINLTGNAFAQTIVGNAGVNSLDSGGGGDTMIGLGGDDFYFVRAAGDRAVEAGGAGDDRVFAAVNFTLEAGSAVEILSTIASGAVTAINLTGNALTQTIVGNAGANSLDSGGGGDTMIGLGGDDFYVIRAAGDRASETAGNGNDQVFAAVNFTLEAGSSVETLSTIASGAVTAINLTGNELAQAVLGNAGANVLDGKGGLDTLTGFGGADTFAFTSALGAGNVDQVSDFQAGIDRIALENAIFTGLGAGGLPASAFVIGSAAADADDRIIYNNATGALLFDADGNGAGAAVQFATLQGLPAISASDFIVI